MKKNAKFFILILAIIFSYTACKENIPRHETKCEGYIIDGINDKPIKGATVKVITTQFVNTKETHTDTATISEACVWKIEKIFTTDERGYFQISFPKRSDEDVRSSYQLEFKLPPVYSSCSNCFSIRLTSEDLEENEKITLGRIVFYPNEP